MVDASHVPTPTPAKSLAERVAYDNPKSKKSGPLTNGSSNPRVQPKSATASKTDGKNKKKDAKGKPAAKKTKSARPKPKTAEELDTEMADYWNAGANNSGAAATESAAGNGAAAADAMEEISVSFASFRSWSIA